MNKFLISLTSYIIFWFKTLRKVEHFRQNHKSKFFNCIHYVHKMLRNRSSLLHLMKRLDNFSKFFAKFHIFQQQKINSILLWMFIAIIMNANVLICAVCDLTQIKKKTLSLKIRSDFFQYIIFSFFFSCFNVS